MSDQLSFNPIFDSSLMQLSVNNIFLGFEQHVLFSGVVIGRNMRKSAANKQKIEGPKMQGCI